MQLILPKTLVPDNDLGTPFYLAGPILGGGGWQEEACNYLVRQYVGNPTIVVPNRWEADHRLSVHRANGRNDYFPDQTKWERYYMRSAARWGCLIFWLPCESKTNPRDDGQPYARDTYGELEAWRVTVKTHAYLRRVVIGAELNFPSLDVIITNFQAGLGDKFRIYPSLEETLDRAILVAYKE